MRTKINCAFAILAVAICSAFSAKQEISNCFIAFSTPTDLTYMPPERLPAKAPKIKTVKTKTSNDTIAIEDGYHVLYKNTKGAPFINLNVELATPKVYDADQKALMGNLKYMAALDTGVNSKSVEKYEFNGFQIYGLTRHKITIGHTLGSYVMFPGNGIIIYFNFNNLNAKYRTCETIDEFKKQRDKFINEYTLHLKKCLK